MVPIAKKFARPGTHTGQLRAPPWRILRRIPAQVTVLPIVAMLFLSGGVALAAEKSGANARADRFQEDFWRTPVPLQGPPPAGIAEPATGLHPEQCGRCHFQQYQDWRTSFHAKAMGPGVVGQFPSMSFEGQASCLECHAPLSEQWAQLPTGGGWRENQALDPVLRKQGLVCAACHLRKHKRFGPPLSEARAASGSYRASPLLHGEPKRSPHFQASEFCKRCHQHPADSMEINGKRVENTYREWLNSPYAAQGKSCQACHMPGGRHLWRGIHDVEMTRSGVTVSTQSIPREVVVGQSLHARLVLENTGTGHAFPTYTTPAVYLRAAFLDAEGRIVPGGFFEELVLQRRLDMSTYPWGEKFDTRVLPGERELLEFDRVVPPEAAFLYLWVWVEPDHFYTGFYRASLSGRKNFPGRANLERALEASLKSQYLLFGKKIRVRRAN